MTEAQALAGIVAWSAECPSWQRDALRRLANGAQPEAADVDALVAICKGEAAADPVTAAHFRDPEQNAGAVHLRRVHRVSHVNVLAADQRLAFQPSGLTIIYGDNGSGKSGYARILKKVCRARAPNRADEIIPDIYDPTPGVPTAAIDYMIGGIERTCVWRLGEPAHPALTAVSVFDSSTANIHVDETNDVAYTPFPLKLLAGLAELCKSVKDKLAAETAAIKARTPKSIATPVCSATSAVGRLLANLSPQTDPVAVEALAMLTQEERDQLAQLTADLAGDPTRYGRQLAALKLKVDNQVARINGLVDAIGEANAAELRRLSEARETTRQAAAAASGALFRDEPLPKIATEAWRFLWESARHYSEHEAYPGKAFPVTGVGDVCVLCQQDIAPAAAERLNRFEVFVRDDSQQRAAAAGAAHDEAWQLFQAAAIPHAEVRAIVATLRDELGQDGLPMPCAGS